MKRHDAAFSTEPVCTLRDEYKLCCQPSPREDGSHVTLSARNVDVNGGARGCERRGSETRIFVLPARSVHSESTGDVDTRGVKYRMKNVNGPRGVVTQRQQYLSA